MNDIVSDTLARIRNAYLVGKEVVVVQKSKFVKSILEVMKSEGFIADIEESDRSMNVTLKYDIKGVPVIRGMKRISKSSRRFYVQSKDLKNMRRKRFALSVISTPNGVLSDIKAYAQGVGGELVCEVY
ncbi:30S ribosomal protein S8 [Candidatus Cytomitobacter primus]|uniref:Small ribosomal subunit protein uS8 n=1 Tax=Candidatus Cytomitobacter primus TaxID=2066024 RepID=A0A5C0UG71_9PROT|nr:30S ribosomal protein S8 [Candidatus Cytomitobacter primus]QEK38727.1 30S ribosomal protein S8 [Candidatus Cytomitobacter primus]